MLGVTMAGANLAGYREERPTYEFAAIPAGLSEEGMKQFGYSQTTHEELVDEWTGSVRNEPVDVTATSHAVSYGVTDPPSRSDCGADDPVATSVGILSTPKAPVDGHESNPMITRPLSELVSRDSGRELLRRLGLTETRDLPLRRPLERIATRQNVTLLGQSTTLETYAGLENAQNAPGALLLHVARVRTNDDAVILGVFQRWDLPHGDDVGEKKPVDGDGIIDEPELAERIEIPIDLTPYVTFDPEIELTFPVVNLSDVRLVQTVEDTHVEGGSYAESDPDLVALRNTSVVFDIDGLAVDRLPSDVHVDITFARDGDPSSFTRTMHLHAEDVAAIAEGTYDPLAVFHEYAKESFDHPGRGPPVVRASKSLDWVQVRIGGGDGIAGDTVTLKRGRDYEVTETRPFRVAFVAVNDSDGGDNYGNSDGENGDYEGAVRDAVDYLQRTYPGDGITAYRHDEPLQGWTYSDFPLFEAFGVNLGPPDFRRAKSLIDDEVTGGDFPGDGEFVSTGDVHPELDLKEDGFDAVVVVAPGDDSGTSGTDYFTYHWGDDYGGMAPGDPDAAVGAMEPETGWPKPEKYVGTVAQEIGHRMRNDPYDGPSGDPTAQRDDDGNETTVSGVPVDHDHAREENSDYDGDGSTDKPGVRSTAFDLTDDTFDVVTDYEYDGSGVGTMKGPSKKSATVDELHSFMSYARPPRWTDARIHQDLIDGEFEPGGGSGAAEGPTNVLTAFGVVNDQEAVEFADIRSLEGFVHRDDRQQGAVTIAFEGPAGGTVDQAVVEDHAEMSHADPVEDLVSFTLEFPEMTAFIRAERQGRVTRMNPIQRSVRDAVGRVPPEGFHGDAEAIRERVADVLDDIDDLMRNGRFGDATTLMREEVRPLLDQVLVREYETTLDQPDRTRLLETVDEMIVRLEALTNGQ